jgi:hypothetical protein
MQKQSVLQKTVNAARSDAHVTSQLDTFSVSTYHYTSESTLHAVLLSDLCDHTGPGDAPVASIGRAADLRIPSTFPGLPGLAS